MWQRARRGTADTTDDMDLIARVEAGTLRAQHRQEAAAAAAFEEDAAARAEADALADAAAKAACARPTQAQAKAKETEDATWRAHWANALAAGQARRAAKEYHRPQPEGAASGAGRDAEANAARAAPPSQPTPAQDLGADAHQGSWYFRQRHLWRAVG
jgi:hypothetical protein